MIYRLLALLGGLSGAAGVGLSAAAAHGGGSNTQVAATFLLAHAPALVAIGLAGRGRWLAIAGLVLAAGVAVFAGDLLARDHLGGRLFPMSAPVGGVLMIAGWLFVAMAGLGARRDA